MGRLLFRIMGEGEVRFLELRKDVKVCTSNVLMGDREGNFGLTKSPPPVS